MVGRRKLYSLYYFRGVSPNCTPVRTSQSQTTFEALNRGGNEDSNGHDVAETDDAQLDELVGLVEADDAQQRDSDDSNKMKSRPRPHSNRAAEAEKDRSESIGVTKKKRG